MRQRIGRRRQTGLGAQVAGCTVRFLVCEWESRESAGTVLFSARLDEPVESWLICVPSLPAAAHEKEGDGFAGASQVLVENRPNESSWSEL